MIVTNCNHQDIPTFGRLGNWKAFWYKGLYFIKVPEFFHNYGDITQIPCNAIALCGGSRHISEGEYVKPVTLRVVEQLPGGEGRYNK